MTAKGTRANPARKAFTATVWHGTRGPGRGMVNRMWLACSQGCGGSLFKVVDAEVLLDSAGDYVEHHILQPSYACANCGAPAFDLAEVPNEMAAEAEADAPPPSLDVLCPVCETPVQVGPQMECPNCGAPLEL